MENKKPTFWEKTQKLIREIMIIVVGVTISIWFTDKYEHYKEQEDVKTFLKDLREELKADTTSLMASKNSLLKYRSDNELLERLTNTMIDSIKKVKGSVYFKTKITTTKINVGDFEGFKSSGKIGTIEHKELKKLILKYYQDAVPTLTELEKYNKKCYDGVMDYFTANAEKDNIRTVVLNPKFKKIIGLFNETSREMDNTYDDLIKQAVEIMGAIDKEVGK
jgi:hypothetical protein